MARSIYPNPWNILLTLLGTCVLAALVWFLGPKLQIGGATPLASFMSRYLIAGGLVAIWAVVTLTKVLSGRSQASQTPADDDALHLTQRGQQTNLDNDAIRMTDTVRLANFGYYGKSPSSEGPSEEMVHYNLPIAFVTTWHDWLSVLMDHGAAAYPDKWTALYKSSPSYRFALSPGIAGDSGWAGIMTPVAAHDGDHFPLCFAAVLPDGISAAEAPHRLDTWYASLERLVQRVSKSDYDFDQLEKHTQQFATSAACTAEIPSPRAATFDVGSSGSEGSVSVRASAANVLQAGNDQLPLVSALLTQTFYQFSVWVTSSSDTSDGSDALIASALPTGSQGLALITRDWLSSGCGNLRISGTHDTQTKLEKPTLSSTTKVNTLKAPRQAPVNIDDDRDITMLKRPEPNLGDTSQKSD